MPPSPKFQLELTGAGTDVFVKFTTELAQTVSGELNKVEIPPIARGTAERAVSLQPLELVVANVTV